MSPPPAGAARHVHAPCGAAHAPVVTTPGAAASSDQRHEPLARASAPEAASTVKARSVDCSGSSGSHGPTYAGLSAACRFSLRHQTTSPAGAAPAACATLKWLPSVSERSSVTAQAPPAAAAHVSVVTTALFSSTRVAPVTAAPPAASACTMDALPGNMAAVAFAVAPAPGGTTRKPTRPAERCG